MNQTVGRLSSNRISWNHVRMTVEKWVFTSFRYSLSTKWPNQTNYMDIYDRQLKTWHLQIGIIIMNT